MDDNLFPSVIGNEKNRTLLGTDIRRDRLGHAFILDGPAGSGRHFFALQIAAAVSCEKRHDPSSPLPCCKCASCKKLLAELIPHEKDNLPVFRFHAPDLLIIRHDPQRKTRNIPVKTIREEVIPNTWIAPEENTKKVYIFEDVDYSEASAQNSLLIPLEDPPSYVLFILITDRASALLETIRSRVPVLKMETFSSSVIREHLLRSASPSVASFIGSHPDDFAEAVQLSGGTIGVTLSMLEKRMTDPEAGNDPYHTKRLLAVAIAKQLFSPDITTAIPLLHSIVGNSNKKIVALQRTDVQDVLEMVIALLRDLIVLKKSADAETCFLLPSEASEFSINSISVAHIASAEEEVLSAYDDVSSNVSVATVLTSLIVK